jgi:regulator of RNase E activity RraA
MMGISRRGGLGRQSAAIARDRGVTAIVVDGNVRDIADLRASGPPYRGA